MQLGSTIAPSGERFGGHCIEGGGAAACASDDSRRLAEDDPHDAAAQQRMQEMYFERAVADQDNGGSTPGITPRPPMKPLQDADIVAGRPLLSTVTATPAPTMRPAAITLAAAHDPVPANAAAFDAPATAVAAVAAAAAASGGPDAADPVTMSSKHALHSTGSMTVAHDGEMSDALLPAAAPSVLFVSPARATTADEENMDALRHLKHDTSMSTQLAMRDKQGTYTHLRRQPLIHTLAEATRLRQGGSALAQSRVGRARGRRTSTSLALDDGADGMACQEPGAAGVALVLMWGSRAFGPSKMAALKEILVTNPGLTALELDNNTFTNNCVAELCVQLSTANAPQVGCLDLANNPNLTASCSDALSRLLGWLPNPDEASPLSPRCHGRALGSASPSSGAHPGAGATKPTAVTTTAPKSGATAGAAGSAKAAGQAAGRVMSPKAKPEAVAIKSTAKAVDALSVKNSSVLGTPPAASVANLDAIKAVPSLTRLVLAGVRLGDRGATQLAAALATNSTLTSLDVSRCNIGDHGCATLFTALQCHPAMAHVNCSGNSIRTASARALEATLEFNHTLTSIALSDCGMGDTEGACVLYGLTKNGTWRNVDLSHNTLGSGAGLVVAHIVDCLAQHMDSQANPSLAVGGALQRPIKLRGRRLGSQLDLCALNSGSSSISGNKRDGWFPLTLTLDDNHISGMGFRAILMSWDALSRQLCAADGTEPVMEASSLASLPLAHATTLSAAAKNHGSGYSTGFRRSSTGAVTSAAPEGHVPLPSRWPLALHLTGCSEPGGHKAVAGGDSSLNCAPSNPWLTSLTSLVEDEAGGAVSKTGRRAPASGASQPPKGRTSDDSAQAAALCTPPPWMALSRSLDLYNSPAGSYELDLAHPASAIVLRHLLATAAPNAVPGHRKAAHATHSLTRSSSVDCGTVSDALNTPNAPAVTIRDITLDGVALEECDLPSLAMWEQRGGTLRLAVRAPGIMSVAIRPPVADEVVQWLVSSMCQPDTPAAWRFRFLEGAAAAVTFTADQIIKLLGCLSGEEAVQELVLAAELLCARCHVPMAFWTSVLPTLPPEVREVLWPRLARVAAFQDLNNPVGAYNLDLSKRLDRLVALRLQELSVHEARWDVSPYFVNWRNATLDQRPLDREGLQRLAHLSLPTSGMLCLDYVVYRTPPRGQGGVESGILRDLLTLLRGIRAEYLDLVLQQVSQQSKQPGMAADASDDRPWWARAGFHPPAALLLLASPATLHAMRASESSSSMSCATSCATSYSQYGWEQDLEVPLMDSEVSISANKSTSKLPLDGADGRSMRRRRSSLMMRSSTLTGSANRSGSPTPPPRAGALVRRRSMVHGAARSSGVHVEALDARTLSLVTQLLDAHSAKEVQDELSRMSGRRLVHALVEIVRHEGGTAACCFLLELMPPLAAVPYLFATHSSTPPMLPTEVINKLCGRMRPQALAAVREACEALTHAAERRAWRTVVAMRCFAMRHFVTSAQLKTLMQVLGHGFGNGAVRVTAMIVLWSRVVDRARIVDAYQELDCVEQNQVMARLGGWHVWTTIRQPAGLHFKLNLLDPEQKDIAREVVRLAVRASTASVAQQRATAAHDKALEDAAGGAAKRPLHGGSDGLSIHMLNMRGNDQHVSLREDDNAWRLMENSWQLLEFDYTRTAEQLHRRLLWCVLAIQRQWRRYTLRMKARRLKEAAAAQQALLGRDSATASFAERLAA